MSSTIVHSEQTIVSSANDGTELYVQKWSTSTTTSAKAEVVIVHGYLEHSNRYTEFAKYLVEHYQMNVTAYDVRGHGKSSGDRAYIEQWEYYHDDLETVLSTLPPTNTTSIPRFLLCHSNGALFTLDYLLLRDGSSYKNQSNVINSITGIILSSPFLEPAGGIPLIKIYAAKLLGSFLPKVQVPAPLMAEKLSNDLMKQEETRNDSNYLLKATMAWAKQSLTCQDQLKQLIKSKTNNIPFPVPFLFIYADSDVIASPKQGKIMADSLQHDDKTIICRVNEQHEVLNEIKRIETYQLIGEWIMKRCTTK